MLLMNRNVIEYVYHMVPYHYRRRARLAVKTVQLKLERIVKVPLHEANSTAVGKVPTPLHQVV
jgi:hypothetical protein